jgi:hypothetical protein
MYIIVVTLWFFASMTIICTLNAATVKDSCPIPSQLKSNYDFNWKTKSNEWSNPDVKPDFLQLVLSW